MAGSYTADADRALNEVVEMIPPRATVFRCGSVTTVGMGPWEAIAALPEVILIDSYHPELSPEEGLELRRQGMIADIMITRPTPSPWTENWSTSTAWATGWQPWPSAPKR